MRRLLYGGAALCVALVCTTAAIVLPLRWLEPPTTAFMLQQPVAAERLDYRWRQRRRIAFVAALAVIASEDQKFLQHDGFDAESIRAALEDYRAGEGLRGASTISQQLAKNLYLWPARSFVRKGVEAYFTVLLELFLPKARILELYLNVAEFGDGVFGVEAAAMRFFGVSAAELSAEEAALLAAVLPSPKRFDAGRPSGYLRERQRWILRQMQRLEREQALASLAW